MKAKITIHSAPIGSRPIQAEMPIICDLRGPGQMIFNLDYNSLTEAQKAALAGPEGKNAYEVWLLQEGNAGKTFEQYVAAITGPEGKNAYEVWLLQEGNAGKTFEQYVAAITGPEGKNAYEAWLLQEGNAGKTFEEYVAAITGPEGKNAFEVWLLQEGNAGKTFEQYVAAITGPPGASTLNTSPNLVVLSTPDIDMHAGSDFEYACGTNQAFTLVAGQIIQRKAIRLFLTGGSIPATLITGQTNKWASGQSNALYDPAKINEMSVEPRGVGIVHISMLDQYE